MEATIRRLLGDRTQPYRYRIAGVDRAGWRAPIKGDVDAIKRTLDEVRNALRADDVRVFRGDGGRTAYALPGLGAADVIEVMKVGSHNGGAEPREVRAVVEGAGLPFDVVFADEAGLEVVFGDVLAPAQASALAEVILDRGWVDSYAFMAEEGAELDADADEHPEVVAYIVHHNGLRLWWD